MTTIQDVNASIFRALRETLPGLPEGTSKLVLTMESGEPPVVQVEYFPKVDGEVKVPVELNSASYYLQCLDDGYSVDVTTLSDLERRYATKPNNDEIIAELRALRKEMREMSQMANRVIVDNCPGE